MASLTSVNMVQCFNVLDEKSAQEYTVEGVGNIPWPRKRCTRQSALNAVRNVKSHSNLTRTGPFTAANVGQRNDHQDARY